MDTEALSEAVGLFAEAEDTSSNTGVFLAGGPLDFLTPSPRRAESLECTPRASIAALPAVNENGVLVGEDVGQVGHAKEMEEELLDNTVREGMQKVGKRKAVLIGIRYDTQTETSQSEKEEILIGTHKDVFDMQKLLIGMSPYLDPEYSCIENLN